VNKMSKRLIAIILLIGLCLSATACNGGGSGIGSTETGDSGTRTGTASKATTKNKSGLYPIDTLPDELSESFSYTLDVTNETQKDNTVDANAEVDPSTILNNHDFNVYYDNTIGCFMDYVKMYESAPNSKSYETYRQSMTSYRYAFDVSKKYKTYTLQPDGSGYLCWQEYKKNIFSNFTDLNAYTLKTGGTFAESEAPITLWTKTVSDALKDGSKTTFVYISDLNEQNGLLTSSAKVIKDMMNKYPEKDFLIMPYTLAFKGKISVASSEGEGDLSDSTKEHVFDKEVQRNYYALAIGDRDVISAFYREVSQQFAKVELTTDKFLFRDYCFTEINTRAVASNGEIIVPDTLEKMPAQFENLAAKSDEEEQEPENEGKNDMFGAPAGSGDASSIVLIDKITDYFTNTPTGKTFAYESNMVSMNASGGEISLKLNNSDMYYLDTDNASVYVYNNNKADRFADTSDSTVWLTPDDILRPAKDVTVGFTEDTVNVTLDRFLSASAGEVPAVIVSVPIKFSYTQSTQEMVVTEITGLKEFSEKYTVPAITNGDAELKFTKTYGFDEFIRTLIDYESIGSSGLTRKEEILESDKNSTQESNEVVDRLNIAVFANEINK